MIDFLPQKMVGYIIELYEAFDTVDHGIFSFRNYNIMVFAALYQARWFESYPRNGQKYVKFHSFGLESAQIKCGVPQGSLLFCFTVLPKITYAPPVYGASQHHTMFFKKVQ